MTNVFAEVIYLGRARLRLKRPEDAAHTQGFKDAVEECSSRATQCPAATVEHYERGYVDGEHEHWLREQARRPSRGMYG